jgi:hypothetical protein
MLRVNNFSGFNAGAAVPEVFAQAMTFEDEITDISQQAGGVYTFSAADIGAAADGRLVVVGCHASGVGMTALTSATIGGVNAPIIVQGTNTATVAIIALVCDAAVGTTADIVLTWNSGGNRCTIGIYTMTGLNSTTVSDFASSVVDGTATRTAAITVPSGGLIVAAASADASADAFAWTNVNEQYDVQAESLDTYSGAMIGPLTATDPLNVQCTTTSTNDVALVAAVWA